MEEDPMKMPDDEFALLYEYEEEMDLWGEWPPGPPEEN